MRATQVTGRARILAASRILGLSLGAGMLAAAAILVGLAMSKVSASGALGYQRTRVFVEKVRACRRHHPPGEMPSWGACERKVREQE